VLAEGLTPTGSPAFREIIGVLRDMDDRLEEVRKDREGIKARALPLDKELGTMLREHRRRLLEYGAAGRLALGGEIEVLPLDDDQTLHEARPVTPDGRVSIDPGKLEARHDAQVKRVLKSGPVSVIILGGGHDLSASVRRLGNGRVEYIRVTTVQYAKLAGPGS
jgi:hypothetical protein